MKSIIHLILSLGLALFFIYAGAKKFLPSERKAKPNAQTELIAAVQNNDYPNPMPLQITAKMMRTSGFLKMIGILQILSGLMIIIPKTRLGGLIFLLPITLNIFALHIFMDNRMNEYMETGSLFALNLVLLLAYLKSIKTLWGVKI